jgi:hypothetical protein
MSRWLDKVKDIFKKPAPAPAPAPPPSSKLGDGWYTPAPDKPVTPPPVSDRWQTPAPTPPKSSGGSSGGGGYTFTPSPTQPSLVVDDGKIVGVTDPSRQQTKLISQTQPTKTTPSVTQPTTTQLTQQQKLQQQAQQQQAQQQQVVRTSTGEPFDSRARIEAYSGVKRPVRYTAGDWFKKNILRRKLEDTDKKEEELRGREIVKVIDEDAPQIRGATAIEKEVPVGFTKLKIQELLEPDITKPAEVKAQEEMYEIEQEVLTDEGLRQKFQSQVTPETTQAELDKLNVEFQKESQKKYEELVGKKLESPEFISRVERGEQFRQDYEKLPSEKFDLSTEKIAKGALLATPLGFTIPLSEGLRQQEVTIDPKTGVMRETLTPRGELNVLLGAGALAIGGGLTLRSLSKVSTIKATQKQTAKKLLGIDKVKVQSVGVDKATQIRTQLQQQGLFADVKSLESASIGMAKKGKIERIVVRGKVGDKDYTMTFRQTKKGDVIAPRLSITDKTTKVTEVFRQAQPKEAIKVGLRQKDAVIQEGAFARRGQILKTKTLTGEEGIIQFTKAQTDIFKVGRGKSQAELLRDIATRQPRFYRRVRQPEQVAKSISERLELRLPEKALRTPEVTIRRQQAIIREKATIEPVKLIDFTYQKPKLIKSPTQIKDLPIQTPRTQQAFDKTIKNINKQTTQQLQDYPSITQVGGRLESSFGLSPQELGFQQTRTRALQQIMQPLIPTATTTRGFALPDIPPKKLQSDLDVVIPATRINVNPLEKSLQPKTSTILRGASLPAVATRGRAREMTREIEKSMERSLQVPKLQQPTTQIPKITTTPTTPFYPQFRMPPIPPIIPRKSLPSGYKQLQKQMKKNTKSASAYTSSLATAFLQAKPIAVSRKEYERLSKQKFTGIETRPVLVVEDEDKPKKKKKKSVSF